MRIAFDPQRRFDCPPVLEVRLNTSCRDEIIPILKGLHTRTASPNCTMRLLDAVAQDVDRNLQECKTPWPSRDDLLSEILVLGAVRLGLQFRLRPAPESGRRRSLLAAGHGDRAAGVDDQTFDWRSFRDNISVLLTRQDSNRSNHLIVAEGHQASPEAAETVRGDWFVPATNIHYPTDSSLIGDGLHDRAAGGPRSARLLGLGR